MLRRLELRDVVINGKTVLLKEIIPEYFSYVIDWRNTPEFNRFLNQPIALTLQMEEKWYKNYQTDFTQGMFIMIDKQTNIPFGTLGYTDYCKQEKLLIMGRLLVGNLNYRASPQLIEAMIIFSEYLYEQLNTDIHYIHVVRENKKVASFDMKFGFKVNNNRIRFPNELFVNNMHQIEYIRTRCDFEVAKLRIQKILNF